MKTHGSKAKRGKKKGASAQKTIKEIIRLEERIWKAAQDRNAKAFQELVPADAIMIFQSGIVLQPEYLATMNQRRISRYELGPIKGFMPKAGTVILYYKALRLGEEAGNIFPKGTVVESTTWIKRGRRWVAVLNQEKPIANGGR